MKMNNFSKIVALSFLLFAGGKSLNAQITHQKIGDNPTMISPTAVLDIESTTKGILMPRVNLTGTLDQAPIPTVVGAPANGLTVFNLNTAGDVTPGYYYWSTPLTKWVRLADETTITTTNVLSSTGNTLTSVVNGVSDDAPIVNSISNTLVGTNLTTTVNGIPGDAVDLAGLNTNIYTHSGTVTAGANRNVFIPDATNLNFNASEGGSVYSFVESGTIGSYAYEDDGRIELGTEGNNSDISLTTIGTNSNILLQPNAGNRFVGIGVLTPSEKLDLGAGNMRIRTINTNIGAATDRIVVADANGVLKSVTAASVVSANNGLTKHATTGAIQLGGDLNRATNIATTISGTTYPFSITGLPVGNTNDYVVLNGFGTGDLKIITRSNLVQEPWNVIGSPAGTQATLNTENIYQMGNVAIGATTIPTITAGPSTINPKLHVAGDISTTGKLWTTNSVYADYVFDYYFDGFSKIYEAYKFKSLKEVAEFIRENKHLPGVTPISEIVTNETGYTIDLTQLSMQQLEKLEELYLHVIEMNDTMNQKDQEIKDLQNKTKELEERLMKLERLIEKN